MTWIIRVYSDTKCLGLGLALGRAFLLGAGFALGGLGRRLGSRRAPAALRLKPPRLGAGAMSRRAFSSSVACSNVSAFGLAVFGSDALMVPSVTYGP